MSLEALIREVDSTVRSRAVYVHDRVDRWKSFAKELLADPKYQLKGDCDDWSQTALHLMILLHSVEKRQLIRAVVISKGSKTPDHMVGLVEDAGVYWSIGDTFGAPQRVQLNDNDLIGGTVNGHIIVAVNRMGELLNKLPLWRGKLKRQANTANKGMTTSVKGLQLIRGHERCILTAYDDFRPKLVLRKGDTIEGTLTIGYGHTGPDVFIGQRISEEEAEALLRKDVQPIEAAIYKYVNVVLTQDQFDALVSFIFNVGIGNFISSTLLKLINKQAKDTDIQAQFRRWNKSKGIVLGGLIARRDSEAKKWAPVPMSSGVIRMNVQAAPLVEEHEKAVKSISIWTNGLQMVLGLLGFLAAMAQFAPDLQLAAQASGLDWAAKMAGGVTFVAGLAMFLRRMYEIKVAAQR